MANFSIVNSTGMGGGNVAQAVTATYKSLIVLGNSSATGSTVGAGMFRRGKLYDILIGIPGTPADNAMEFDVTRITLGTTPSGVTTLGISSLSSNFGLDPADNNGFVNWCQINSSAEVGIAATTQTWYEPLNQRASYRWVCNPGSEIVWPAVSSATTSGGLALRVRSAGYTGTAGCTVMWQEQ